MYTKYLLLLIATVLISTCSNSKHVIETFPNKMVTPLEVINKSTIEHKQDVLVYKEILKDSLEQEQDNMSLNFNQAINKRFIEVHDLWNDLLQKYVSDNGKVNYQGLKKEHISLINYFKALNLAIPNETQSRENTLTYWINAYNAMTIDLILRHYPIKSIKDIKDPWQQRLWKLGEKWYNLDDIEHQILRKMDEPRIHFAIVCASVSCPKLLNEAYSAENLESQLTQATKDFLNDHNRNSVSTNSLELSKIFDWFSSDFTKKSPLVDFLNLHTDIKISVDAKKTFKDYNWNLNE